MAADLGDPLMPTGEEWEDVKSQIFRTMTMWEIIVSKVQAQQPENPTKRLHRLFEEVEAILDMLQMEITNSCRITINDNSSNDFDFIIPDKNISRFLGISPHNTRIYILGGVDKSDSVFTAAQLVKVQLDTKVQDNLADVKVPIIPDHENQYEPGIIKTEIKAEVIDYDGGDYYGGEAENEHEEDVSADAKRALYYSSEEYLPTFPVSKDEFEKMLTGKLKRKCPKCGKNFVGKRDMTKHFRAKKRDCRSYLKPRPDLYITSVDVITGKTKYACSLPNCPQADQTWGGIQNVCRHWEEKHSDLVELPLECEHCPAGQKKRFVASTTLTEHVRSAHPETIGIDRKCPTCGEEFKSCKNLRRHLEHQVCDKKKKDHYTYKPTYPVSEAVYEEMVAGKIPKKCPKCNKDFGTNNVRMIRHFRHKRMNCSSFVPVRSDLCIEVKDEATGKIKFGCAFPDCPDSNKRWNLKCNVNIHWESKHSESVDMPLVCDYCPKRFILSASKNMHIRDKHAEKLGLQYHCSRCGKQCKSLKILQTHEKQHVKGEKSFHCDFCDHRYDTQGKLNSHIRYAHADKCSELGLKVKVYHCEHCGKECRTNGALKQHIDSWHTDGPNPKYKCPICSKQLKQENSFGKHMANAHGVGERCKICNKLYKTIDELNKHIRNVHDSDS